jgi:uncharacterized protein with HEPN domain
VSPRDWDARIEDIIQAATELLEFASTRTYEQFAEDARSVKAAMANFIIVGKAVKNIPAKVMNAYPDVPWDKMARMRDMVVHVYFNVDPAILWETIHTHVPALIPRLRTLLDDHDRRHATSSE